MIKTIQLNDKTIQYNLQYKKVKNINLRIKPDMTISVSAHKRVSEKVIDEFLLSKADFILNALNKYENISYKPNIRYFSEDELRKKILKLCEEVYPYYEKMGISYPQIKFRKMVSRWGSCHTKKKVLTFNLNLVYAPCECAKYVVYHEFTHFLVPNHSKMFYEELSKVYPEWKAARNILKEIHINKGE